MIYIYIVSFGKLICSDNGLLDTAQLTILANDSSINKLNMYPCIPSLFMPNLMPLQLDGNLTLRSDQYDITELNDISPNFDNPDPNHFNSQTHSSPILVPSLDNSKQILPGHLFDSLSSSSLSLKSWSDLHNFFPYGVTPDPDHANDILTSPLNQPPATPIQISTNPTEPSARLTHPSAKPKPPPRTPTNTSA